jgi:hypothetical protein
MPQIISFPFTYIGHTRLGKIYRPYALVHVYSKTREKWQPIEMIIDTGADYSLLPKRYAAILGISMDECEAEQTVGIGGIETIFQYKNLPIKIGDWQKKIPVGFLEKEDVPALMGRLGCIEALKVTFNGRQSIFST